MAAAGQAIPIRPLRIDEVTVAVDLVVGSFQDSVAPLYGPDGIGQFLRYMQPDGLARRLSQNHVVLVACDYKGRLVGLVEVRDHRHISLLFVETRLQRGGLGRRLVEAATDACRAARPDLDTITVHASPNSVGAYERFGFTPTGPEQETNGIRFVSMALDVKKPEARDGPRVAG